MFLFQQNSFYIFPVTVLTKLISWNFEISNLPGELFKKKRLKFLLTWDPMGVKISKCYSPYRFDSFSTKLFLMFPVANHTKLISWNFEI